VIVTTALTDTAMRTFVRWRRHRRHTLILSSTETTRTRTNSGSRAPQTILGIVILQSKQ
jgi:hypothetical protein